MVQRLDLRSIIHDSEAYNKIPWEEIDYVKSHSLRTGNGPITVIMIQRLDLRSMIYDSEAYNNHRFRTKFVVSGLNLLEKAWG